MEAIVTCNREVEGINCSCLSCSQKDMNELKINYKKVLRQLEMTNEDIAKLFGYKSSESLRHSTKYPIIMNAVVELYNKSVNKMLNS